MTPDEGCRSAACLDDEVAGVGAVVKKPLS
jgi:hypothetical protein